MTDLPIDIAEQFATLERANDRDELERAAIALVASGDAAVLERLGTLLTRAEFLARLDALEVPSLKTRHLSRVMAAFERYPTPATAQLSLQLAGDRIYLADPDRRIFLLRALAAVRPMGEETVVLFRRSNAEGYFSTIAILLADNGSPRALDLLAEMIADRGVPAERRVDAVRFTIYPRRTTPPVLELAGRLHADLDDEVAIPLIESIFDDRPDQWFDPGTMPAMPPRWEGASTEAIEGALAVAPVAAARLGIPDRLRDQVNRTRERLQAELERRRRG